MTHVPGGAEEEGRRFNHATQNGARFKIYELFISGIFHLLLDYGWRMVLCDDLEG